jgi:hypothetical protein
MQSVERAPHAVGSRTVQRTAMSCYASRVLAHGSSTSTPSCRSLSVGAAARSRRSTGCASSSPGARSTRPTTVATSTGAVASRCLHDRSIRRLHTVGHHRHPAAAPYILRFSPGRASSPYERAATPRPSAAYGTGCVAQRDRPGCAACAARAAVSLGCRPEAGAPSARRAGPRSRRRGEWLEHG